MLAWLLSFHRICKMDFFIKLTSNRSIANTTRLSTGCFTKQILLSFHDSIILLPISFQNIHYSWIQMNHIFCRVMRMCLQHGSDTQFLFIRERTNCFSWPSDSRSQFSRNVVTGRRMMWYCMYTFFLLRQTQFSFIFIISFYRRLNWCSLIIYYVN